MKNYIDQRVIVNEEFGVKNILGRVTGFTTETHELTTGTGTFDIDYVTVMCEDNVERKISDRYVKDISDHYEDLIVKLEEVNKIRSVIDRLKKAGA